MSSSPQRAGRDEYGFVIAPKGPRPEAKRGASLMMIGAAAHVLAVFLPWYQGAGRSLNGMDSFPTPNGYQLEAPGRLWIVAGIVLFFLGLITWGFGRILGVAIAGVIIAFAELLFGVAIDYQAVVNAVDLANGIGNPGAGIYIGFISILITIAGSIQVLSRRRV